jgi:MioC protein
VKVTLLVATMTGTAEMLAEDLVERFGAEHAMRLVLAEDTGPEACDPGTLLVVVSSTYGTGEVPTPAKPLFAQIEQLELAGHEYAVIALGDRNYGETFAMGGRRWDAMLAARGARRLADPLVIDFVHGDDMTAMAIEWFAALAFEEASHSTHLPTS